MSDNEVAPRVVRHPGARPTGKEPYGRPKGTPRDASWRPIHQLRPAPGPPPRLQRRLGEHGGGDRRGKRRRGAVPLPALCAAKLERREHRPGSKGAPAAERIAFWVQIASGGAPVTSKTLENAVTPEGRGSNKGREEGWRLEIDYYRDRNMELQRKVDSMQRGECPSRSTYEQGDDNGSQELRII